MEKHREQQGRQARFLQGLVLMDLHTISFPLVQKRGGRVTGLLGALLSAWSEACPVRPRASLPQPGPCCVSLQKLLLNMQGMRAAGDGLRCSPCNRPCRLHWTLHSHSPVAPWDEEMSTARAGQWWGAPGVCIPSHCRVLAGPREPKHRVPFACFHLVEGLSEGRNPLRGKESPGVCSQPPQCLAGPLPAPPDMHQL